MAIQPKCCENKESLIELEKAAKNFSTIAEPNRLKILCILRAGERCVCDIWQYLNLPQNLVSHHLKVLKDMHLINSRKEGLKVYYSLDQKYMAQFNLLLKKYF